MDNLLIDRETLGKFVDALIKQKPSVASSPEELNSIRENAMRSLNDRICNTVLGQLTKEQDAELRQLLIGGEQSEEVFQDFFNRAGINLEATIAKAIREFGNEFLERRQNA